MDRAPAQLVSLEGWREVRDAQGAFMGLEVLVKWMIPYGPYRRNLWEPLGSFVIETLSGLSSVEELSYYQLTESALTALKVIPGNAASVATLTALLPASPSSVAENGIEGFLAYRATAGKGVEVLVKWKHSSIKKCCWIDVHSLKQSVLAEYVKDLRFVMRIWRTSNDMEPALMPLRKVRCITDWDFNKRRRTRRPILKSRRVSTPKSSSSARSSSGAINIDQSLFRSGTNASPGTEGQPAAHAVVPKLALAYNVSRDDEWSDA